MTAIRLVQTVKTPVCILSTIVHTNNKGTVLKGRKEIFYLTMHIIYLRLCGTRHIGKDHSDSERGDPLPPHGLLFPVSSKGSFICTIPQTG